MSDGEPLFTELELKQSSCKKLDEIVTQFEKAKKSIPWTSEEEKLNSSQCYYECPLCRGEGEVDGETYFSDHVASGIQVFGVGENMTNLEDFMLSVFENTQWLIDQLRDARLKYREATHELPCNANWEREHI